jgi:hypothetical protein
MPAKPPRRPRADARIGGYLRMSNVHFPDDCHGLAERQAFIDDLRRVRKAELVADAARRGESIEALYDDLGVSGRGQLLQKRTDFERLRLDARAGRVRTVYARDLSRLFRDLVQQELWFAEMESCGVGVQAQDLPFAPDPATRRLLRQQMGAIHEYAALRQGAIIQSVLSQRVAAGLWVGRCHSVWGLTYRPELEGFAFDPETADRIRLVFEAFVACAGVAGQAARRLNDMVRAGEPRATRTPFGSDWCCGQVLGQVRNPLYRRRTTYRGATVDAPALIPESVPPTLVAEADRLLEARAPRFDACAGPARRRRQLYTYTGLARCGNCGGTLSPVLGLGADGGKDGRWVSWRCAGRTARTGCDVGFSVSQARLDALTGLALAAALAAPGRDYGT